MRSTWAVFPFLAVLAACGDPLGGIERVSELPEPLPETDNAAVLPDAAEIDADTPIFAGLFRRNPSRGASDPAIEEAVREANGVAPEPVVFDDGEPVSMPEPAADVTEVAVAPAPERRGVLGWLRRAADVEPASGAETLVEAPVAAGPVPAPEEVAEVLEEVQVASLETPATAPELQKRRGLFGLRALRSPDESADPRRNGPDAQDVALGTQLPFGTIARVCDAKPRDMGEAVAKAARRGRGYVLYDSAPDSPTARTFYITGFADHCPRQFTAAIALFGEPVLHEQLRYGLPAGDFPYSTTDEAYETVKARVCNVGRTKPCGPRISRLENTTTFVSAYENFGENARWSDMLLHDGEMLAAALKTR